MVFIIHLLQSPPKKNDAPLEGGTQWYPVVPNGTQRYQRSLSFKSLTQTPPFFTTHLPGRIIHQQGSVDCQVIRHLVQTGGDLVKIAGVNIGQGNITSYIYSAVLKRWKIKSTVLFHVCECYKLLIY